MSETQVQWKMVTAFSQGFPEKRGQLFHVSNERNNPIQAMKAKGIGIFNGVSDLIYFTKSYWITGCAVYGIEVKEENSRHKRDHIIAQMEWGQVLESNGGKWRICKNVEQFLNFITDKPNSDKGLSISDVQEILKNQKTKTILF